MAAPKITTGYTQPDTKLIVKPDIAKYTDKNGKVSAKYQTALTNFYAKSTDPEAVGTWDPSKNTQATPFGDVLSGLISGYKNPYAANYVNPLAAVEKPKLTNIQTPFNKNAIPQDLVNLFNSAGTNYAGGTRANPLVRPILPNNGLVKLTQPSATESAEQLAKPGAPDTTNTQIPVVTDKPPVVTDKPPVVTDKPPVVTDKPANWGYVKTPEEIAADKIAADKIAPEEIAADKIAADKIAADKIAADKIEADRQAGLVALANQQAAEKAAIANTLFQQGNITAMPTGVAATGSNVFEKPPSTGGVNENVSLPTNTVVQAVNPTSSNQTVALPTSVVPSVSAGTNFTGMSNNLGPQQVTLNPSAVVTPSGINTLPAQTVSLPSSGPQPINPSNGGPTSATVGPISAAQNNLGPLNISNLGAVISPQAMNSNAGGVASLVGPQVTVQPQPAVSQQPAVNYTYAPSSQQQLEDQAVNAGYQGDYSDTAAMQGYLNSLPR